MVSRALGVALLCGCAHTSVRDPAVLFAADRAFNALAQDKGVQAAFVEFADPAATVLKPGGVEVGKAAVRATFAGMDSIVLVWEPKGGELSADGQIGWTWGTWRRWKKSDASHVSTGRYLTTWRKGSDGRYRWSADIGDSDT